jgi:hypothetical protein
MEGEEVTAKKPRPERYYSGLREKYPAYPDLRASGLTDGQICMRLNISATKCRLISDAFGMSRSDGDMFCAPTTEVEWRRKYPIVPELVADGLMKQTAFPRQGRARRPITDVHPGIDEALRRGGSYRAIGAEFGLCRERVRQIAKALGIEKVRANPGHRRRTAAGLTLYQQKLTEKYPDILNPLVVPSEVPGVSEAMVYKIRKILGISFIANHITIKERIVSVINRPMTIPEIASALDSVRLETLHIYLSTLAGDGRIRRPSRGVYAPAKDLP